MSYNIMAINPGHNGSVALVVDGSLTYYEEEERLSRMKYDGNPFRAMLVVLEEYHIDELIIGGTNQDLEKLPWTAEDAYTALVRKFNPNVKVTIIGSRHHIGHAANAFYNSGFEKAIAIVVDGAGSYHNTQMIDGSDNPATIVGGFETESVYRCSYPNIFEPLYKNYGGANANFGNNFQAFNKTVTITKAYEAVSHYLGFGFIEAGKTMGLSPYGRKDPTVPKLFDTKGKGNQAVLVPYYPAGAYINEENWPQGRRIQDPKVWHRDFTKCTDIDKNLAWQVQHETQELMGDLIEAVAKTGETNIVISGGYGLNCVANYYYLKRFPNLNIYIDPISGDGGTAIGLALMAWYSKSGSSTVTPLKSLYLGTKPKYEMLEPLLKMHPNLEMFDTTPAHVADIIDGGSIVSMFSGRSEAGPRALGNRSILYDPRHSNGKNIVNAVKGREWFRPFAGSVMAEHANSWFEMRTLKSSPFMMYAVNVLPEKLSLLGAVTHVDGTCRIQTVDKTENPHYYELIEEFYKKTGVPILFNTSFNLAGDPLVDSLNDAIDTILRCDIRYLYLPELGKLIFKR